MKFKVGDTVIFKVHMKYNYLSRVVLGFHKKIFTSYQLIFFPFNRGKGFQDDYTLITDIFREPPMDESFKEST